MNKEFKIQVSTKGPVTSVHQAIEKVKEEYNKGNTYLNVEIIISEGIYYFEKELNFAGLEGIPITIKQNKDDKVIFDGGRAITGWEESKVNGVRVLKAFIPEVKLKTWDFIQLFVNEKRCEKPRLPETGIYKGHGVYSALGMERENTDTFDGTKYIKFEKGDMKNFKNTEDVIVVVDHLWISERMPIENIDFENCILTSSCKSCQHIKEGYYLENVFEELKNPGQWYLDKESGYIYYVPYKDETAENIEAYAPILRTLVNISGKSSENKIYNKHIQGIEFRNTSATHDPIRLVEEMLDNIEETAEEILKSEVIFATTAQGENNLPSSIKIEYAENISIENCNLYKIGNYAIGIDYGCKNIKISECNIYDIAGGGIKVNGASATGEKEEVTSRIHITDNHVYDFGEIYKAAVGIFFQHACDNVISHNHIHDGKYSGISCGWEWGFQDNISKDNLIEYNHIHNLGYCDLSDMGGIYILGVQPGTVVRGNHVHDIVDKIYGGWCIYLDGGASHVVVENNVGYNAHTDSFHQNFGRENTIRNNIFVSGGTSAAKLNQLLEVQPFTFTRNILVSVGAPIYIVSKLREKEVVSEGNLFYSYCGDVYFEKGNDNEMSFEDWKKTGNDRLSIIGDPKFKDIDNHDFTILEGSPSLDIGFVPIDTNKAGIRRK